MGTTLSNNIFMIMVVMCSCKKKTVFVLARWLGILARFLHFSFFTSTYLNQGRRKEPGINELGMCTLDYLNVENQEYQN